MSESITAQVTAISHEGRGIARINGKTVFIEGALPGEAVEFVYTKKRSQYDEGKVVEVVTPAANRVTPKCPYFGVCGGCSLQHISAAEQLQLKQKILLEQLQPETVLTPIIGPSWGYRRKARLGVKYVAKKGKVLVGFREKNARFLANMDSCEILHPSVGKKIMALSELIASLEGYQIIPQIEVAVGDEVTALVFRHLQELSVGDLDKLKIFGKEHGFYIYLQPKGPDTVHLLYPKAATEYLSYKLNNIELLFHPTDFTQVNAEINQQMVVRAIELLEPQPDDSILDLFCGLGNFTIALASHCNKIVGVEGSQAMVQRAKMNAEHNNITNAEFYVANLAEALNKAAWVGQKFNKILLDPPRTGALEVIKYLPKLKPQQVLYISCNPATLARDAEELVKRGFKLAKAGIMDMFPHTSHVEAMVLFE